MMLSSIALFYTDRMIQVIIKRNLSLYWLRVDGHFSVTMLK